MEMKDSLHFEVPFTLLFRQWKVVNTKDAILSCLLLMIISLLYECLKYGRSHLNTVLGKAINHTEERATSKVIRKVSTSPSCQCVPINSTKQLIRTPKVKRSKCSSIRRFLKSSVLILHLTCCLMYGLEMFISLSLMLSAMSFHIGVIVSIVVGAVSAKIILMWPRGTRPVSDNVLNDTQCH
uniref:uncharacterized protein LOC120346387 n=1 Tax=Styela clava TaxID=7725 RepID=UPI0019392730|nr:uncharacterized protein LOC120346387 [Styela clava]